VLHTKTFTSGPRAALQRVEYRPTSEKTSDEYPFLLITGRTLYQFNAGTMTMRGGNRALRPADYLDISPVDAERLNLTGGESVRVRSRHGEAVLPLRFSKAIKEGELFATFHTPGVFLNRVTGPLRDSYVQTPEYKVTAVRVDKLSH
jgi:formate dehydrogenase major subunit